MCELTPYQIIPGDDDRWFVVQLSRGQSVCPLITNGSGYEDVRNVTKLYLDGYGYKGYHVGVREIG